MIWPSKYSQKQIIFQGDSLFELLIGATIVHGGQSIPIGVYNGRTTSKITSLTSLATSGDTITNSNVTFSAREATIVKAGDIVIMEAVTNDLGTLLLTGAQAYAQLTTYCNAVMALGAQVIVCTMIARDKVGDPADIETQRLAYNALVVANSPSICTAVCDVGADAMFNSQADCANTTNYQTDKLHLNTAGTNNYISLLITTLNNLL